MSLETLKYNNELSNEALLSLGSTVFEALAIDADQIIVEDDNELLKFKNSVTRTGDGQTVPDER